jgi:hypothetical protein
MAVGRAGDGSPLADQWDGTSWTKLTVPPVPGDPGVVNNPTGTTLNSVSCTSSSFCVAVGEYGDGQPGSNFNPVAEHWNGLAWTLETTFIPAPPSGSALNGISCTAPNACTALGDQNAVWGYGPYVQSSGQTYAANWNGLLWQSQTTPNAAGATWSQLLGVACTSATTCTGVGFSNGGLVEQSSGNTWTLQSTPSAGWQLSAVSCPKDQDCIAIGYGNPAPALQWDGTTWNSQNIAVPTGSDYQDLVSLSCANWKNCMAVGLYGTPGVSGGSFPLVERYS